jgi:hypothetical protein
MRRKMRTLGVMVVFCAGTGFSPAFGQDELAKLLPADGELEDYFGSAVGISGGIAVVGMPYDDDNGDNAGAAYVFLRDWSEWVQAAKLLPTDGEAFDLFGASVAIDQWGDDWAIVVGAPRADDNGLNSGAAYLFLGADGYWYQAAKFLAYDGAPENLFGTSVAISGQTIVVGVGGINTVGEYNGSAYVYRFGDGQVRGVAKLVVSDGAEAGLFDVRVAIDGDVVVIGAPYDDENGRESGSAYVFRYVDGDWVEEAKLLASEGAARDYFGWSLDVAGDTIVVGARGERWYYGSDPTPGAVYVFRYVEGQWVETGKLETGASDWFGASLSIDGDALVVGAPYDEENGEGSGSAYAFRYTGANWTQVAKLLPSDGAMWDQFGCAVAVSGDNAVIGALRDDDQAINSGSAYVFEVPAGPECLGDLDGDNDRDLNDLAQLLSNYGTTSGAAYEDGDLDGDEDVDLNDLSTMLAVYGTSCG